MRAWTGGSTGNSHWRQWSDTASVLEAEPFRVCGSQVGCESSLVQNWGDERNGFRGKDQKILSGYLSVKRSEIQIEVSGQPYERPQPLSLTWAGGEDEYNN